MVPCTLYLQGRLNLESTALFLYGTPFVVLRFRIVATSDVYDRYHYSLDEGRG